MTLGKRQCREFGNKFPPTLPISGSHFGVDNLETNFACHCRHLIILCPASLSRCHFTYCYRYHPWLNTRNSRHYLILSRWSYLLFIHLLSSSVQPVVPLESLPLEFSFLHLCLHPR